MSTRLAGLLLVAALAAPGIPAARADAPQIGSITPLGLRRGESTEVTIGGGNLGKTTRLVAPFEVRVEPIGENADAGNWKARLVVPEHVPVGIYPVRVATEDGISNPFLVAVGQLPRVAEQEDNGTPGSAQAIASPAVVEGQAPGNDVDYYRFGGKKGERIVVDAQCLRVGSTIDPSLRLTTAAGAYVASADDTPGLLIDARIVATLPEDGDYILELSDSRYQGGGRPVYRLLVGAVPVVDEVFPLGGRRGETVGLELRGGTLAAEAVTATRLPIDRDGDVYRPRLNPAAPGQGAGPDLEALAPLALSDLPEVREPTDPADPPLRAAAPVALNGRLETPGDEDRYVLAVTPGQRLHIEVAAAEFGSSLDGVVQVLNASGGVIATGDDTTEGTPGRNNRPGQVIISPDPSLDVTVPAGQTELTLVLRDLQNRGGVGFPYRITVEPAVAGFAVVLGDDRVSVPRGGWSLVPVTVVRKGYNGPITLDVLDPPPGLKVRPAAIGEGQAVGVLSVGAAPDAAFGPAQLKVVGKGQDGAAATVQVATRTVVFAQQGNLPLNTLSQNGLAAAPALAGPVGLEIPEPPVEAVHGFDAAVPVKVTRPEKADGALALTPLPLPPGVAVPNVTIAEKAAEGSVAVKVGPEVPVGRVTIGLIAKGKFADKERTLALPGVTLDVVRPASLELAAAELPVKAGETAELKGKVVRKGPFKDPVTVKLEGLPAGLKADPVTVAPDASEFAVKVVAEPTAAAATAPGRAVLAFQIGGKDYPTPPTALTVKVTPK